VCVPPSLPLAFLSTCHVPLNLLMGANKSREKRASSARSSTSEKEESDDAVEVMAPMRRSSLPQVFMKTHYIKRGPRSSRKSLQEFPRVIGQIKRNSDVSGILNRIALQFPKIKECVIALQVRVDGLRQDHVVTKLPAREFLRAVFGCEVSEAYMASICHLAKQMGLLRWIKSKPLYSLQHCLALCGVALQEDPQMVGMTWEEDREEQMAAKQVAQGRESTAYSIASKQRSAAANELVDADSNQRGDVSLVSDAKLASMWISSEPLKLTTAPLSSSSSATLGGSGLCVSSSTPRNTFTTFTPPTPPANNRKKKPSIFSKDRQRRTSSKGDKLANVGRVRSPSIKDNFVDATADQQSIQRPKRVEPLEKSIEVGFRALIKLFRALDFQRVGYVEMNDLAQAGLRNPKSVELIKHVFKANGKSSMKRIRFAHFFCGMLRYSKQQIEILEPENSEIGIEGIELKTTSSFHGMSSAVTEQQAPPPKSAIRGHGSAESRAARKLRIKALNEARVAAKQHVFAAMEEKHRARILQQKSSNRLRRASTNTPGMRGKPRSAALPNSIMSGEAAYSNTNSPANSRRGSSNDAKTAQSALLIQETSSRHRRSVSSHRPEMAQRHQQHKRAASSDYVSASSFRPKSHSRPKSASVVPLKVLAVP
jgi:hypothetical protein